MSDKLIQFMISLLIFFSCLFAFNNLNKRINIYGIFKKFRRYSIYYPKFAYFILGSIVIIFYSKYIVENHITPIPIIALLLPFVVMLIIPIGTIYYIIRASIHIYKIAENKFQEDQTNKIIWINDIIYLLIIAVVTYSIKK